MKETMCGNTSVRVTKVVADHGSEFIGWEEILLFSVFIITFFSQVNPVFMLFLVCNSCFFVM